MFQSKVTRNLVLALVASATAALWLSPAHAKSKPTTEDCAFLGLMGAKDPNCPAPDVTLGGFGGTKVPAANPLPSPWPNGFPKPPTSPGGQASDPRGVVPGDYPVSTPKRKRSLCDILIAKCKGDKACLALVRKDPLCEP